MCWFSDFCRRLGRIDGHDSSEDARENSKLILKDPIFFSAQVIATKVVRMGAGKFNNVILSTFLRYCLPCNERVTWYNIFAPRLHFFPHFPVTTPRFISKMLYQISLSMIKSAPVGRSCHYSIYLNSAPNRQFAPFCPRNQLAVQIL